MNSDFDKDILISFIVGDIDPDLRKEVNERLKSDGAFKALYIELVTLSEGIRLNALKEKKKLLHDIEKKLSQNNKPEENLRFLAFGKILLAASLIGIILIITFNLDKEPLNNESISNNYLSTKSDSLKNEQIAIINNTIKDSSITDSNNSVHNNVDKFILNTLKMYVKPELVATILRSNEPDSTNLKYESALISFHANKYIEVQKILNIAESSREKYLKGHAYFNLKQFVLAENIFFELSNDEYAPEQIDAEWFLLLTYSVQFPQKKFKAKTLANKIAKNQDSKYRFKALEILKALN